MFMMDKFKFGIFLIINGQSSLGNQHFEVILITLSINFRL